MSAAVILATGLAVRASAAAAGMFAYPLDDTYIHLEVAWRLIEDGTWGLNPGEPASASSSPLWTLLLAAGLGVSGHRTGLALAIATACAVSAVVAADGALRDAGSSSKVRGVCLSLLALLTPLPVLGFLGMEHALQATLALVVFRTLRRSPLSPSPGAMLGLGLLCTTRLEGLFLAGAWGALCLARGNARATVRLLAVTVVPLALWGLAAATLGTSPIPNGYLMKTALLQGGSLDHLFANLRAGAPVWTIVTAVVALDFRARGRPSMATGVLVATAGLQLTLGGIGWYYRYEAWLIAWGIIAASCAALEGRAAQDGRSLAVRTIVAGLVLFAALGTNVSRSADAFRFLPGRVTYIADAKVRLARTLGEVAPHATIALHDVGAMAWETDLPILDTAGLGTDEVRVLHMQQALDSEAFGRLSAERSATLGLASASWLSDHPPRGWRPAARLHWGLGPGRTAEPFVAYAIAPGAEDLAQEWMKKTAAGCGARARAEAWDGHQWSPIP